MEEYIKKLLEQVRFQKAHKAIGDELRSHIEDQIETNISEGMDRETAEKIAVEDMGDPVETGIALDKVHRPQVAWGVIVAAIGVGLFGAIIHFLLEKLPSSSDCGINIIGNITLDNAGYYLYNVVCGIVIMLGMYLIDYTMVAKYSKVVAALLLISYTIKNFAFYKRIENFDPEYWNEIPSVYTSIESFFSWSGPCIFLLVPLFAGILYKYKGQKYKGLIKSLIWIIVSGLVATGINNQEFRALVIVICLLVELTIAIEKEWIKVPKVQSITAIWLLFTVIPIVLIRFMYDNKILSLTKMNFVRSLFGPATSKSRAKELLSGVKTFGSGSVSYMGGKITVSTLNLISSRIGSGKCYMITKVAVVFGGALAFAIITVVAALIVFGFVSTAKTKNQLGMVMGSGCMLWLAINAILNMFISFGMLPAYQYTSFFPFISNHKVVASYALLGIILSIYKYKDAYPQHIDITIRTKSKDLES